MRSVRSAQSSVEDAWITRLLAQIPHQPSPAGPGDDAAVIAADTRARVVTTDALVEGVHFVRTHPPTALGWKTLAVNLSDVAAMGATPEAFTLSMALPADLDPAWLDAFAAGLGDCARATGVVIAGGDTVRSPGPLFFSVTAWGTAPMVNVLTRTGGQPGDRVMVAGSIGRAGIGLRAWLADPSADALARASGARRECLEHQLSPRPPLWAGPWALAHGAHAGMDLSDGLAADLPRLATASGLGFVVDLAALPADPALAGVEAATRAALGEDYGLVVLVPAALEAAFAARGFCAIGEARAPTWPAGPDTPRVVWRDGAREVRVAPDFEHFTADAHEAFSDAPPRAIVPPR